MLRRLKKVVYTLIDVGVSLANELMITLFISMLDAQVDTNTQVQVYRTPIANGVFPDTSTFIYKQHDPTSLIYVEHHNNNKCLALIETAAKLPNFWHVVPDGTYRLGFSEEVFVVSHQ